MWFVAGSGGAVDMQVLCGVCAGTIPSLLAPSCGRILFSTVPRLPLPLPEALPTVSIVVPFLV